MTNQSILYIRLFGHFEITYDERLLTLGKNKNSVNMRLLQILTAHGEAGISREKLMRYLFREHEVADIANSLRVNMYRLRKQIVASGIPKADYFLYEDGVFRCNASIPFGLDIQDFTNCIEQEKRETNPDRKMELLLKAANLYRGEFLEESGAEEWVIIRSVLYKQMYEAAMNRLMMLLRKKKDYKMMLEISSRASRIYPYDEWQVYQIEGLVMQGRSEEGYEVYKQTAQRYKEELEIQMPASMTEKIRKITKKSATSKEVVGEIGRKLKEPSGEKGAIYLTPYSFVDTFRFLMRLSERNHQIMSLMVCVLRESAEKAMEDPQILEESGEALMRAIRESLRKGDCYTRYSDTQFLILLTGTGEEKCELVFRRIDEKFCKYRRAWHGTLKYYIEPISILRKGEGKVRLKDHRFLIEPI